MNAAINWHVRELSNCHVSLRSLCLTFFSNQHARVHCSITPPRGAFTSSGTGCGTRTLGLWNFIQTLI